MQPHFAVFIATSLDGFIARENGSIDWLHEANRLVPEGEDCGYSAFIDSVDAILMGRKTFETVLEFDHWPYGNLPVYIISRSLRELPPAVPGTAQLVTGEVAEISNKLGSTGHRRIYIDGGETIQSFLSAGAVTELTITRIPILLGKGRPLFGHLRHDIKLDHVNTKAYPGGFVQSAYKTVIAA